MEKPNPDAKSSVTINQAWQQQERINDLFKRIDLLSVDMFADNKDYRVPNYRVVYNDLNSVFLAISSKLSPDEIKGIDSIWKKLRGIFRTHPPFGFIQSLRDSNKVAYPPYFSHMDLISDTMQEYRMLIEQGMEAHGFTNPNKSDASKSITDMT